MVHVGDSINLLWMIFQVFFIRTRKFPLDRLAVEKVEINFAFLKKFSNKLIYGINTGFGPMAQYKVSEENMCCNSSITLSGATAQEEAI